LHIDDQENVLGSNFHRLSATTFSDLSTMAFPGSLCRRLKRSLFDAVHMGKARDGALFKGAFSAQNDQKGHVLAPKTGVFGVSVY
jgi:hypothetical protein